MKRMVKETWKVKTTEMTTQIETTNVTELDGAR